MFVPNRLLFLFLFMPLAFCFSQEENNITAPVDSLYREDQFYIGVNYDIVNNSEGVKVRGFSGGLHFGYFRDMPFNKRRSLAIAVGAGFAFDQYGENLFIGETPSEETVFTVLDDATYTYDRNRFSTAVIEIPFEFRWRSSTPETYKFWRVYAGFRLGYAYYYQATFKQPGNNITQTDIPEFDPVRLSATLSFGWNTFNFFGSYAINPFFKDAFTTNGDKVDFRAIKIGLIFYIL